jgi:hypothetical protein
MACFLVPTGEAIVTTIIKRRVAKSEAASEGAGNPSKGAFSWKTKLSWLTGMLWGGAGLLALEHIWHGEVVFYPPFLTAMSDPADTATMLHEMSTVGVSMAVLVTLVWVVMILIAEHSSTVQQALSTKGA